MSHWHLAPIPSWIILWFFGFLAGRGGGSTEVWSQDLSLARQ
jgi:hypothetical protein